MEKRELIGLIFICVIIFGSLIAFRKPTEKEEPTLQPQTEQPKNIEVIEPKSEPNHYSPKTYEIILKEESATPDYLTINKGDTVVWKNTGSNRKRLWIDEEVYSDMMEPGQSYSYTFTGIGDHTFRDVFNGLVRGAIVVKSQPSIQITGSFLKGFTETQKTVVGIQFTIFILAVGVLIYTLRKK
ncbi:hypothetical protein A3K72_02095 [Candidatus Woesearchaeota archaeon RBG_13_36_6]|nr:MAG: hypothetical protein A3K72_02095 [Candidatus Woesearchaeota archaeon RBG_13_36_6]